MFGMEFLDPSQMVDARFPLADEMWNPLPPQDVTSLRPMMGAGMYGGATPPSLNPLAALNPELHGGTTPMSFAAGAPPIPTDMPTDTLGDAMGAGVQAGGTGPAASGNTNSLLAGLRGVTTPTPPTAQKVSTPAAPARMQSGVKGGQLLALLDLMRGGGAGAQGSQLPATLGQALVGRR